MATALIKLDDPTLDPPGSSRKQRRTDRLREAAYTDAVTSLPNRRSLHDTLNAAIRNHRKIAVLMLDLDGFKPINDRLGHSIGDAVLTETAKRLQASIRKIDTVGRLGGDEFLLIVECDDLVELGIIAQRIIDAIAKPYIINQEDKCVTIDGQLGISIGIAIKTDGETGEQLIHLADTALQKVKETGKNRAEFANIAELEYSQQVRIIVANTIGNDRLDAPLGHENIIELATGECQMREFLLRWMDSSNQRISPAQILQAASHIDGGLERLNHLIMLSAARKLKEWQHNSAQSVRGHINLSAAECTEALAEKIQRILEETQLAASSIGLEIGLPVFMHHMKDTMKTLEALEKTFNHEIQVWIDNIGSPQQVGRAGRGLVFPVFPHYCMPEIITGFKISPDLTALLKTDPNSDTDKARKGRRQYVASQIAQVLAHERTIIVVGLEDNEQVEIVQDLGVQYGQGFVFNQ